MNPFSGLRDRLPPLAFDPARDTPSSQLPFLADYLGFYQLDYAPGICRQHFIGKFTSSGYEIVGQYFLPAISVPRGSVFVLHGYYDHVGLYHHLIRFLLEQGYVAIAYDLPGHGLSSGERACINHFSEYGSILHDCLEKSIRLPKPWHGLGQSTGGAIWLQALLVDKTFTQKHLQKFHGFVLLAPLIRPAAWKKAAWSYYLLRPFIKKIKRYFSNNSNDAAFVDFCSHKDPLQPQFLSLRWVGAMKEWFELFPALAAVAANVLVIQGEADGTIDWRYNIKALKQKLPDAEVVQLPLARHQLVNEEPGLRRQIFTRIHQFLLASR